MQVYESTNVGGTFADPGAVIFSGVNAVRLGDGVGVSGSEGRSNFTLVP